MLAFFTKVCSCQDSNCLLKSKLYEDFAKLIEAWFTLSTIAFRRYVYKSITRLCVTLLGEGGSEITLQVSQFIALPQFLGRQKLAKPVRAPIFSLLCLCLTYSIFLNPIADLVPTHSENLLQILCLHLWAARSVLWEPMRHQPHHTW